MSQIEEILRGPVADVRVCPCISSSEDVSAVAQNLEALLTKCLYCIRGKLPSALEVFLSIIAQSLSLQPEALIRAMLQSRGGEVACIDLFCDILAQVLSTKSSALRLCFDTEVLFDSLQCLCGDTKLKTKLGASAGPTLLRFMQESSQHSDDYRTPRNCASALITLLRGSSANKNRFGPECSLISKALESTTDFFFQMQCVEILFRLYSHNKTVLSQAHMSDYLRRGISSLPNDATLLLSIQSLLDSYNAEFNSDSVLQFSVLRMEAGDCEVCGHTTMFFSPLLVVVFLPGGTGDNFTIPYEHVRSVKLSKDHRLVLRLNTIPPKLSLMMDLATGSDTLNVFLTQSTLAQLRSCNVHEWISERKRNAPTRVTAAGGSEKLNARSAQSQPAPPVSSSQGRSHMSERNPSKANSQAPVDVKTHKPWQVEEPSVPAPSNDSRLQEIHSAAAAKAARQREQQLEHLHCASDRVQAELDELQRRNGRDRDQFEDTFREDMIAIRRAEAALKDGAAACVRSLNSELEDVQTLGALLKSEVDTLREKVANAVGRSEGVEEACLVRLKDLVDAQMHSMERHMSELTESSSLCAVSQYIADRMSDVAAGSVASSGASEKPKARRLEYS